MALIAARRPGWDAKHERFTLPNGWRVTPAGRMTTLPGDMPGNILVLDGGKRALVNTCGFHDHSLSLVDLEADREDRRIRTLQAKLDRPRAARGRRSGVGGPRLGRCTRIALDGLKPLDDVAIPGVEGKDRFVSSIVVGPEGTYALNIQTDEAFLLGDDGAVRAKATVGYRPLRRRSLA